MPLSAATRRYVVLRRSHRRQTIGAGFGVGLATVRRVGWPWFRLALLRPGVRTGRTPAVPHPGGFNDARLATTPMAGGMRHELTIQGTDGSRGWRALRMCPVCMGSNTPFSRALWRCWKPGWQGGVQRAPQDPTARGHDADPSPHSHRSASAARLRAAVRPHRRLCRRRRRSLSWSTTQPFPRPATEPSGDGTFG